MIICNKYLLILFGFLFITNSFAQELEYNNKYILNPSIAINLKINSIDKTAIKKIKSNILIFSNQNVIYNLNFAVYFNTNKQVLDSNGIEIFLTTYSKQQIVPFDLFGQSVRLIIVGRNNKEKWEKEFSFKKREIKQEVFHNKLIKLELRKYITQKELNLLRKLWKDNTNGSVFYLKGMYGVIELSYPTQVLAIYEELFK